MGAKACLMEIGPLLGGGDGTFFSPAEGGCHEGRGWGEGESRGRWERVEGGRQRARESFVVFRVSIELLNARRDVYFGSCPLPTMALVPDLAFLA